MRSSSNEVENVENEAPIGGSHGRGVKLEKCTRCGREFEAASMIAWREGMVCLRDALDELERELHGTPLERRRELREIDRDRREHNAAADRQSRRIPPARGA